MSKRHAETPALVALVSWNEMGVLSNKSQLPGVAAAAEQAGRSERAEAIDLVPTTWSFRCLTRASTFSECRVLS